MVAGLVWPYLVKWRPTLWAYGGLNMTVLRKLTSKQQRLCEYTASHGNVARASREAEYADHNQGYKTLKLPHVAAYLRSLNESAASDNALNLTRIAGELGRIGLANIKDYYDADGCISLDRLSRDAAAAIAEFQVTKTTRGVVTTRIKLHGKLEALDKLAKMVGGYEAHNAQKAAGASGGVIPVRDLARRVAFMLRTHAESEPVEAVVIENDTGLIDPPEVAPAPPNQP